jgi:signal transduction histidine kinase
MSDRHSNAVAWRNSIRTRIAALVVLACFATIAVVGVVLDRSTAVAARDRLRSDAIVQLDAARFAVDLSGQAAFGASLRPGFAPARLEQSVSRLHRATWFDGETMWAAERLADGRLLTVRVDAASIVEARDSLRHGFLLVGGIALVAVAALSYAAAGRLSRTLRNAAETARQIAAGDHSLRATASAEDEAGALVGAINHMVDELEARLLAEQHLTADVAHELRTPITALVSATELLPEDADSQRVRRQVQRIRSLTEDLLELSRMEFGPPLGEIPLIDLAEAVTSALIGVDPDRLVEVRVERSMPVRVRREDLERLLANLIANAQRHGAPPIEVTVDGSELIVADHGRGFPPELLATGPRRFASAPGSGGTGLGLVIVAGLAARSGGSIELGGDDRGATVTTRFSTSA